MRKRIRGIILAVSALLVLTPNTVMAARMEEKPLQVQETAEQAADEGTADSALDMVGDGTETAPYRIKNAEQLRVFADMVNGVNGASETGLCAVLTCDIDLSAICGADIGSWTPIGTSANPYTGIFDGDSFAITGLYYHKANSSYGGLFACNAGIIKNLGVVDADIAAGSYTGGVCGYNNGIITGCYSAASVKGASYTGGICGYNDAAGTVSICYNTGAVSGKKYVGGVCGYNKNTTINCYNMGTVSGKTTSIGGICGYNKVLVSNCYNAGTVSSGGRNYVGSVCGYNHSASSFQNCYYLITGEEKGNYGVAMTQEQFASGEVCWLLNDGKSKNVVWYQTCGAGFPAFGGKVVYQIQRQKAGGRADEIIVAYTNETEKKQAPTNIVSTEGNNASAEEDYYENNAEANTKEHIYAKPEWVWQEYDAAKAVFTCQDCGEKITLKASISEKTTEATCAQEGKIVYTASVVRDGETYTDKKTEKLEKTAHRTLERKLKAAETCTESGISLECWFCPDCGKYFKEQAGNTEIPREEVEIPAKGHQYGEPNWKCSPDKTIATASFTCTVCKQTEERTGKVTSKTTASCTKSGETIYKAQVEFNGKNYEYTETLSNQPIPHSYGEPTWIWKGYASADAVFTCIYGCGTTEKKTGEMNKIETAPTCSMEGKIEYTVKVRHNDNEFSDTKEETIPRKDHQYGEPKWEWADDNKSAVAIFTCTNCGEPESIRADVKTTEIQGTGCGMPGEVKYTASVTFKETPYYDFKTEQILIDHTLTRVSEVPATCESDGKVEYWVCSKCNKWFSDEACSNEIINREVPVIPATGHTLVHVKDKLYRCTICDGIFSITVASDGTIITMYSIEEDAIIMQDETENDTGIDYSNEGKQNEAASINEELPSQPDSEEKQEDSGPQDVDEKDIQNDQDEASMQNEQSESEEQNENKGSDDIFDVPENAEHYGLIYPEGEEANPATADAWEGSTINLRAESAGKAAAQTVREQQPQEGYPLWVSVAVLAALAGVVLVLLCKGKVIGNKR